MDLSPQQLQALGAIAQWYEPYQEAGATPTPFRLFGPAGTGKTTLAKDVAEVLGLAPWDVQYGAYTGKAASVLRRKGCEPAGTLHSLVYRKQSTRAAQERLPLAEAELAQMRGVRDAGPDAILAAGWASIIELDGEISQVQEERASLIEQINTHGWVWNPLSELASARLLILDEVSMVDARLAGDIERFDVPVLVLGDPEQLEPVGGEGYYTGAAPHFALTEVHRQALDSPVLALATRVRTSTGRGLGLTDADMVPRRLDDAMAHDQVLCWKNATRWRLIDLIRRRHGRPAGQVVAGDRVMCLTNNSNMGVFNGQQFDVLAVRPGTLGPGLSVRTEDGDEIELLAFAEGFEGRQQQDLAKRANLGGRGSRGLFTFADAITVHKAQGSEWGSVYVVNEAPDLMDMTAQREGFAAGAQAARRWLYTAVTRAADTVTLTTPSERN